MDRIVPIAKMENLEWIRDRLADRAIWFGGFLDLEKQKAFMENLKHTCLQKNIEVKISPWKAADGIAPAEIEADDWEEKGDMYSGMPSSDDYFMIFTGKEASFEILQELECLAQIRPESVLLISSDEVYGKIYGTEHDIKEHELGYVCHSNETDMDAQWMRTQEHLSWRLAKELGLNVKMVRMPDTTDSRMAERALRVLLMGKIGEIYNLPLMSKVGETQAAEKSPLAPIKKKLDFSAFRQMGN